MLSLAQSEKHLIKQYGADRASHNLVTVSHSQSQDSSECEVFGKVSTLDFTPIHGSVELITYSSGNHRPDGPGTGHALTFKVDHSNGADQWPLPPPQTATKR